MPSTPAPDGLPDPSPSSPRFPRPLLAIILAAGAVRVGTLWVGKPAFSGWFNHVYYYFVQVRGLLTDGVLPYPDMPLLFYLDAAVATVLHLAGMPLETAVIAATRLVMCLIAAAMPIPLYALVRELNGDRPLRGTQWGLVALSGLLPFTVIHIPEMFQKNMAGLLLMAGLLRFSLRLVKHGGPANAIRCGILALLIVLTHFGTTAALVIYWTALLAATAAVRGSLRHLAMATAVTAGGALLAVGVILAADPQRFARISLYLGNALEMLPADATSLSATVLISVAIIAVLAGLAMLLRALAARMRRRFPDGEAIFLLTNLLFAAGLVLPVFDQQLTARLMLFLSLPLFVVMVVLETGWRRRTRIAVVSTAAVLLTAMAIGETISAAMHNAGHREIHAELMRLRKRDLFRPGDLIIARTGVEHVCNWVFETRAGVITTVHRDDFGGDSRIFILNPKDGLRNIEAGTISSEWDAYRAMRSNIPAPRGLSPLFDGDRLTLFLLHAPPAEWRFGEDGFWTGIDPPPSVDSGGH